MSFKEKVKKVFAIDDVVEGEKRETFCYAMYVANSCPPMTHICPSIYDNKIILERESVKSELGSKNEYKR